MVKSKSIYYPRIIKILQEKDISINSFATMLNVPRSTLSSWLNGVYEPSLEIIEKSAKLLDFSIDEIIFELKR